MTEQQVAAKKLARRIAAGLITREDAVLILRAAYPPDEADTTEETG